MADGSVFEGLMTIEMKFDKGKDYGSLPYLDFPLALKAIAKVGTMGANKYKRHSWKGVTDAYTRYQDAFYRHLTAHNSGEELDEESGLPHQYHVAWNLLALLQLNEEK